MEKVRFDDFIKLNRGFDLPDACIEDGPYPVVASTNIKAYHKDYKIDGPAVTTGRSGSLGKVQYIEGRCWPLNTSLYVKDFKGNNPRYVYYFLQTMHLEQYNAGAGVPTLNQNHLHSLKLLVHEKNEQSRVASILSAYDKLIENNNKRIRILEKMAENLYKEWFVRFRFPGHENVPMENGLPKGWKYFKIEELCYVNKCSVNIAKSQLNNMLYLDTGGIVCNKIVSMEEYDSIRDAPSRARRVVVHNSILYSTVRPNLRHYGILKNPPVNMVVSTGFTVLDSKYDFANIVYLSLSSSAVCRYFSMIADCAVATYPSIKPNEIGKLSIVLPDFKIAIKMNKEIEHYFQMICDLQQQNRNLARQRDLLLPRLMSGKLEVKP